MPARRFPRPTTEPEQPSARPAPAPQQPAPKAMPARAASAPAKAAEGFTDSGGDPWGDVDALLDDFLGPLPTARDPGAWTEAEGDRKTAELAVTMCFDQFEGCNSGGMALYLLLASIRKAQGEPPAPTPE